MNKRALHCQGVGGKTCGRPLPPRARKYCAKCRVKAKQISHRAHCATWYSRHKEQHKQNQRVRYKRHKVRKLIQELLELNRLENRQR